MEAHDGDMSLNDTTDPVTTYTIRIPTHRPGNVRPVLGFAMSCEGHRLATVVRQGKHWGQFSLA
ncbi:hypothetical protein GCM10010201_24930 [Pilimelia columellifera subsp. columellifera]|uniref:Uncharacterized protein n=1 Tax=Pilimelia columellifera subsp. columellifera TaxID=706583 RepID=A0ABN3NKT0_9ACTN